MKKTLLLGVSAMLLVLGGCNGGDGEKFNAAAATSTDAKINVHMVKSLVEDQTEHTVEITQDLSASPQVFAGIDRDEFQIASLYSGEVYNNYFDEVEFSTNSEKTLKQAQKFFGEEHDIKWYDPVGFINNYSIAIKEDMAMERDIETISDLGQYADELTLGTDNAWIERDNDGYRGFKEAYGYEFSDAKGMDVSLMYQAIDSGDVDVATSYTVDPQIIENDLTVLEDDEEFFPPYEASLVASNNTIDNYPKIDEVLESMVGLVSTEQMTELMYEVEVEERSIQEVADEFLQEQGMLD